MRADRAGVPDPRGNARSARSPHAGPVGVIVVGLLTLAVCVAVVLSRSTQLSATAQTAAAATGTQSLTAANTTLSTSLLADAIRPTAHPSVAADDAAEVAAAAAAQAQAAAQAAAIHAASVQAAAQASACGANPANTKHVLVSISTQTLWACSGTQLVSTSRVTTGRDGSTPTGTFHVQAKEGAQYLNGCDSMGCWHDYVHVWIPFLNGVYGFHDAPWQTMPFGSAGYTTQGSHGCVHLPEAEASWVDNWITVGTSVTIEA